MKKTNINVSRQCFGRPIFAISMLLAVLFVACGNPQKAQAQTASLCGDWEYNDNETVDSYRLNLSSAGEIKLSVCGYYDVAAAYNGAYSKQNDGGDYAFMVKPYNAEEGAAAIDGRFAATIDDDGLLHFTLKSELANVGNSGTKIVFHKPGAAVPFNLPAKPNVLDFFKAAYPLTFDGLLRDAYEFVVLGKSENPESGQEKTVDLPNGYIKYMGGGVPPGVIECCYWKCGNGDYLFAINMLGESPDIQPTREMLFFRFDMEKKAMQSIDPPYTLQKLVDGQWSFKLPRQGKNIKVIYLNEDYSEKSTTVLKWNGRWFENVEQTDRVEQSASEESHAVASPVSLDFIAEVFRKLPTSEMPEQMATLKQRNMFLSGANVRNCTFDINGNNIEWSYYSGEVYELWQMACYMKSDKKNALVLIVRGGGIEGYYTSSDRTLNYNCDDSTFTEVDRPVSIAFNDVVDTSIVTDTNILNVMKRAFDKGYQLRYKFNDSGFVAKFNVPLSDFDVDMNVDEGSFQNLPKVILKWNGRKFENEELKMKN